MSNLSELSSPRDSESSGNSKFKTLKKKIRNKFRQSRTEDGNKTIAQAVETLRRSDEILATSDTSALKNEFKELKETLESILNQNQVLSDVVKTVDSACPDPFKEPEKFSVFLAQKTISSRSYSDEFFEEDGKDQVDALESGVVQSSVPEVENALVRLQNLRMEEQKSFCFERQNYETRLGQLSLLQQEIEVLRKQNDEHEIQLEFWKSKRSLNEPIDEEVSVLKREKEGLLLSLNEVEEKINVLSSEHEQKILALESEKEVALKRVMELESEQTELKLENEELKKQIEEQNLDEIALNEEDSKSIAQSEEALASSEREKEYREISEENARLKIELNDLEIELNDVRIELNNYEKGPQTEQNVVSVVNLQDKPDESAFKYVYLSNLILKYLQFPEKRTDLSNLIISTLQTDQEYFKNIMSNNNNNNNNNHNNNNNNNNNNMQ